MKKIFCVFAMFFLVAIELFPQLNVSLLDQFDRGDSRYAGSWIYHTEDSTEFALLGTRTGVAAYNMDGPIEELGFIPGPPSNYRELTVIGDHAFVVTEGSGAGAGMQILDLTYLPDSLHLVTTYTATFTKGHIIQRDIYSEEPYVYVNGVEGNGGISILDISDPEMPLEIGVYEPGYFIHDCMIKGNRVYASAFYESQIDVLDISDKANPVLITTISDPGLNTHSSWITEDNRYLVICDELNAYPMRILNIEDLDNPFQVSTYSASSESLVHNPYIKGDYLFLSHNAFGLRILDIANPELPVEIGYYDTYSGGNSSANGLWSACPFSNSGKVIGANRNDGLYIFEYEPVKAGRLYGTVVDSLTGVTLFDANVLLENIDSSLAVNIVSGVFKYGDLARDDVSLTVSRNGYNSKTITFDLLESDSLWFEFALAPDGTLGEQKSAQVELGLFPNPTTGSVTVNWGGIEGARFLVLTNSLGQEMSRAEVKGRNKETINVGSNPKGHYFLKIEDENGKSLASANLVIEQN